MAAAPLVSATSLAAGLGMAVKNAAALLEQFQEASIVVEVTHPAKRRLFGLAGLAPLRDGVAPHPAGRCREGAAGGRRIGRCREKSRARTAATRSPASPLERRVFDYSELEAAMAVAKESIRRARRNLAMLPSSPSAQISEPAFGSTGRQADPGERDPLDEAGSSGAKWHDRR